MPGISGQYGIIKTSRDTQVSDVEDEVNGLFTYDRQAIKPDPAAVRAVNEALEAEFEKVLKQA